MLYEALKYSDTAPVSQDPPPSLLHQCEGIKLKWDLGNPHHTYPFGMHSPSNLKPLDYDVLVVNSQESMLRVRSHSCTTITPIVEDSSCLSCQSTQKDVRNTLAHAQRNHGKLSNSTLSHRQLCEKIESIQEKYEDERLKHFNMNKAIERLRKHRTTLDALLDLLGTKDVPALHRIFRNAHKFGWGSKKLLEKVTSAIDGKYHAKNFVDWELDLAILIYKLGGNGALHALHNLAFAFPCRQMLNLERSTTLMSDT
ncbi:hypothetical protein FA15DRAFT_742649 [Coprinopsis marcescibilis]|uniref:Uncharacterized protein n=1 Tax=Coprinopsis marcescibilis TaxID=230819 RepID=A0A5C3K9J5_COPMA|nr:hypothetical protein FA15DRAFT_742649 [Coprinopsis marcescibilis]